MSNKLFLQIVLLILIANVMYFATVQVLNWQARHELQEQLRESRAKSAAAVQDALAASRSADVLEQRATESTRRAVEAVEREVFGPAAEENENVIDGQPVRKVDGNWVNDDGQVVSGGE